jgi:hypothetical protein
MFKRIIVRASLLALACSLAASAQSTFATLTGAVMDPTGAAIAGAQIEAIRIQTNFRYTATANDQGVYTLPNLPEGTYRLRATAQGFQEFAVDEIILAGRDIRRVDVSLRVGTVDTVVEVQGGATLVETETARIADAKDREVLRALPLTLRRAWDYFTMTPQVERTGSWHISIAGSKNNQSIAAIDGAPINDAFGGTGIGPLMDKTEALQELRIDMAQGGADQMTMGQVTLISRGGSNDFHGAISDYYSTDAFRARNPFQNTRASGRNHIFTASLGGPIYIPKIYNGRNNSFFFFTYEAGFGSPGVTNFNNGVPLAAWREGDFGNAAIRDPFNGNAPFPNNVIPAARINPTSRAIQERFYALPNFGDTSVFNNNNFRDQRKAARFANPTLTTRIDQRINDRIFVYGRWTGVRWNIPGYDTSVPLVTELFSRRRDMDAITGSYSHAITPMFTNEFRYGFTRQDFPRESPVNGLSLVNDLGLRGLNPDLPNTGGIHQVAFTGLGVTPLSVQTTCQPCSRHRIHNFTNNATWFRGAHTFKMGVYAAWSQYTQLAQDAALFGVTEYSNRFTGQPYADFLLGIPTTMRRAAPAIQGDSRRWDYSLYITDEWKVASRLTLTAGVRWDVHAPWTEANNRMAIFDIAKGNVVVPNGALSLVSPLLPSGYVDVVEASQAGRPSNLVRNDWNNFAPRVGLAWRPFGNNTVFRGGFGIYYDTASWQPSSAGAPFVLNEPVFTNPTDNPLTLPNVFPGTGSGGPASFTLPNGIRPDLRIPLSMQYTATIEHSQWDTGFRFTYTGTNTRQGIYRWNANQPFPDERLYVNKPRLFPNYPDIFYVDNGGGHQYHAFTMEVERRMKSGLHFQGHYTLASDIGDLERGASPENAYDRARERSKWERYPMNRFSGNVIYELPFGKGRRWGATVNPVVDGIFGGWLVSTVVALESGRYITPLWRGPDPTGTAFTNGANRPLVTIRPDHLVSGVIDNPTPELWFNPNAFAAPPIGRFGNSAKGVLFGAPTKVMHASVAKYFMIKERARLKLEMLATNAFNTPNYQDPNTRIDQTGAVGRITNVINRNLKFDSAIPRELQAQIRLEW